MFMENLSFIQDNCLWRTCQILWFIKILRYRNIYVFLLIIHSIKIYNKHDVKKTVLLDCMVAKEERRALFEKKKPLGCS